MNIHLKTNEKISLFHDSIWMQEALLNILKNSIEHSNDNSSIYIEVTNSPIHTEIIIQDFGEGIASEDLPYIFDRFYKAKILKRRIYWNWLSTSKINYRSSSRIY